MEQFIEKSRRKTAVVAEGGLKGNDVVSCRKRARRALYRGIRWKAEPETVKVPYLKYIGTIVVVLLEYRETREILWESAATMWQG